MEVISGWTHRSFPMADTSFAGEARRHAVRLAGEREWSDVDSERLAIVVTELATNLAKHTSGGELLVAARDPLEDIEVIAVDQGPGMADIGQSMSDGFSTTSTAGTGLGAVSRQSDSFEVHSSETHGTVAVARLHRRDASRPAARPGRASEAPAIGFGAICVPVKGETVCGDGWLVGRDGARAVAFVADGLGHGPDAAAASQKAVGEFAAHPFEQAQRVLGQVHEALRATRGAAVMAVWLGRNEAHYAGAGNVVARLISGTCDRSLVTGHGTLGLQVRRLEAATTSLPAHAMTIVHSDGIQSRWAAQALVPMMTKDPVLMAARLYADHSRRRDDVCIVVLRSQGE
ncbi:MAG: SpoIIE family protein phosphatase [Pseudomonadota bacterium]|nr:SpoIIE family protein phosphatase [Pseudomonadota bacterium]